MKVTKFNSTPMGTETPYYLMCEMTYDSAEDLKMDYGPQKGKLLAKI